MRFSLRAAVDSRATKVAAGLKGAGKEHIDAQAQLLICRPNKRLRCKKKVNAGVVGIMNVQFNNIQGTDDTT